MNDRTYNWHTPKNQIKSQPSFWADAGFGFTSLEATVDPALLKGMMKAGRELVGAVHDHGARIGAQLHKLGVRLVTSTRAAEISDEGVMLVDKEGRSTRRAVDSVVLAVGSVSRNELVHEVEGMAREVYVIGDASRPRNGLFALREGAEVGRRI